MQQPRGTRDLFGEELVSIRLVMRTMNDIFKRYSYEEVETPIFEYLELFTKKSGSNVVGQLYAFKDKSSRDLALRPELTAPVVRFYIQRLRSTPKPVKIFYFGHCFRYEEPQARRWRQFLQAGVEIIGSKDPAADAEVAALSSNLMQELGFMDRELRLGHIHLLREILVHSGIREDAQDPILRAIDSREVKRIDNEFKLAGIRSADQKLLRNLIGLRGGFSVIDKASKLLRGIPRASKALDNLREIISYLVPLGVKNISIDLGIARGLDYYTGFVFEIYLDGVQVAGGGRYDGLVGNIGGEPTPAVGVGYGVDRIARAILTRGMALPTVRLDCVVLPVDDKVRAAAMEIVTELRKAGMSVDTDFMGRTLRKAMAHANALKASRVVVVGKKDLREGRVVLRDMGTGKQEQIPRGEIVERLKSVS